MSQSQERLRRLLALLGTLQSGRVLNSMQLAQEVGVSRRTVFRDLKTLAEAGVPVVLDEERQGYYLATRLQVPPGDLTVEEVFSLLLVAQQLGGPGGVPFLSAAASGARKLVAQLPNRLRQRAEESVDAIAIRLDPHNRLEDASEIYRALLDAFMARQHVRIRYGSLMEQQEISTLLSPYRFLFSRRSWYVVGRSSLHRQVRIFNVGRIRAVQPLETTYQIPKRFSLERHLKNAWHLIPAPQHRQTVVVRFDRWIAANVAEVTWHPTQKLTWEPDGSLRFEVLVDGLDEIRWWILGYGQHAEVLSPPALRAMLLAEAEGMATRYRR